MPVAKRGSGCPFYPRQLLVHVYKYVLCCKTYTLISPNNLLITQLFTWDKDTFCEIHRKEVTLLAIIFFYFTSGNLEEMFHLLVIGFLVPFQSVVVYWTCINALFSP